VNDAADDGAPSRRAMLPIHRPEIPPLSDLFPTLDEANDLKLTAADAESLRAEADVLRASAAAADAADPLWRTVTLARAVALEEVAAKVMAPEPGAPPLERGAGGEVQLRENSDDPWPRRVVARATRASPDLLDAEVSQERLGLAREAGALTLALDAAEGMGAASPAEQMLAHQMATAHAMAMRLLAKADAFAARKFLTYGPRAADAAEEAKREQVASIEAARLATAAARMMEATVRAALAIDRLRNGSRQTVIVQHVAVADGGQAVVAGAVATGVTGGKER